MHRKALLAVVALVVGATSASAQQFNGGIPSGWTCTGNCGTSGADGVVTLAPSGGTRYGWVSTNNGVTGVNLPGVGGGGEAGGPTNGSQLRSVVFNATAGDLLTFRFNYVTTDGAGFADYAWARLLTSTGSPIATIFTARTTVEGSTVPGFGMPPLPPSVILDPSTVTIIGNGEDGPVWSPLGGDSGSCFDLGCGYTGWVRSQFTIGATGQFIVEFGVTNWADENFDSGLAFDGLAVNGEIIDNPPPSVVPEPSTVVLVATGLLVTAVGARRRRRA